MTKYEKIKQDIRRQIDDRILKPNQVIMSENEMCSYYGVSRITVRKAMDDLCAEGLLYRIRGKGCFVKEKSENRRSHIYSFTEEVLHEGKKPGKKQLSFQKRNATEAEYRQLKSDEVYEIKSLYFADGEPYSTAVSVLPASMFPKLDFFNFDNRSLYEVLRSFYHIDMYRVRQTIDAVCGTEEINRLLNVEKGHPLLRIEAATTCIDRNEEKTFELYDIYIRTDIQNYYVEKFAR